MNLVLILDTYLKQTNSFIRFLLVGVLNTLLGLSIMFMLLNVFDCSYWISTFLGNAIGAFVSYMLNKSFTFKSNVQIKTGAPRFIAIIILCYFLAYALSDILTEMLYHSGFTLPLLQQNEFAIILGSGIYTISNYIGQKYVVFRNK